jgi:GNAT superfamily N-acetyltransferase
MLSRARPDVSLPPAIAGAAFLRDGTEVWIRPVGEEDRELVLDFLRHEPEEALERRYFETLRPERAGEEVLAPSRPDRRLCLVALGLRADRVAVLGVGEYARRGAEASVAEVAFLVARAYRGRGIATLLLARLARAARVFGVVSFEARIDEDNPAMLEVFRGSGLPYSERVADGEIDVEIPLVPGLGGPPPSEAPALRGGPDGREPTPGPRRRTPPRARRSRRSRAAQPG